MLIGNIALGPLLDGAVVPQAEAALPWIVLAILPLLSALVMMVLTQILRRRMLEVA